MSWTVYSAWKSASYHFIFYISGRNTVIRHLQSSKVLLLVFEGKLSTSFNSLLLSYLIKKIYITRKYFFYSSTLHYWIFLLIFCWKNLKISTKGTLVLYPSVICLLFKFDNFLLHISFRLSTNLNRNIWHRHSGITLPEATQFFFPPLYKSLM